MPVMILPVWNGMAVISTYLLVVVFAWLVTGWIRYYALKNAILDHPNHRSLHTQATPRGGGSTIALLVFVMLFLLYLTGLVSRDFFMAMEPAALVVTVTGWIDDRRGLPAHWRGLTYLLCSIWATLWITGVSPLTDYSRLVYMVIATGGIMWLINLYNFMDGTDGLAGSQAVITAVVGAWFLGNAGEQGMAILLMVVSAATSGFLIWNWPPARIFMGDAGSCLVGLVFGAVALASDVSSAVPIPVWLVLLSIFICDTTMTLVKRVVSGETWYLAHRQHAYQRLVQMGMSHKQLTCAVISVNLLILVPAAFMVNTFQVYAWWITGGIYLLNGSIWLLVQGKYNNHINGNRAG